MTKQIIATLALLATTACGQVPTTGTTLPNSLNTKTVTSNGVTFDEPTSQGPAIDYNKRTASTFSAANIACNNEGRALCSMAQYEDAYHTGRLEYTVAQPGFYWMVPTTQAPGQNGANRNLYQANADFISYIYTTPTLSRSFYCCR